MTAAEFTEQFNKAKALYEKELSDKEAMTTPTPPDAVQMPPLSDTAPAPMTEAPAFLTWYYGVNKGGVSGGMWENDDADRLYLLQGRAFAKKIDAQACWGALFGSQS